MCRPLRVIKDHSGSSSLLPVAPSELSLMGFREFRVVRGSTDFFCLVENSFNVLCAVLHFQLVVVGAIRYGVVRSCSLASFSRLW
ncbi:hypothetical protein V144x_36190 [Gimesia aquarii]|uniref:Uncharacterized protein n=1 Tax=Gimesia aquarii TaxID=2527964 RepID=A0A517VYP9_9PLAN|nr:hypothetical protein V144x_36190 [Gimesia aquarii]